MLQHFQGKCVSLTLMVPAAQLHTQAVAPAITCAQRVGSLIKLEGDLCEEISHGRFLDSWTGCVPWRTEEHKVVKLLASDASQSRWDATLSLPGGVESTGDYFGEDLGGHDITVKEAFALLKALQTFSLHIVHSCMDMLVDNKLLYHAWLQGGCQNQGINCALKQIFETVLALNVALHLEWVPSAANPANQPSREWSDSNVKLAPKFWELVISLAGPHSIDLMALDSNSQCHHHYTHYPTPLCTEVNFLAHNPCSVLSQAWSEGKQLPISPFLPHQTYTSTPVILQSKGYPPRSRYLSQTLLVAASLPMCKQAVATSPTGEPRGPHLAFHTTRFSPALTTPDAMESVDFPCRK